MWLVSTGPVSQGERREGKSLFFHETRLLIGDHGTEPSMSDDLVIAFFYSNVRKENCDVISLNVINININQK